ncbi:uncharacterized protein LOC112576055 [Pomacea canaliculata]|uniref:uncharacterized protein LOC112576055 n=1 Tax=Pomacea canaliculata TaxID=400727 RepID=UPI000D733CFE|nr:uncharacterized protein LOC112576055 [Pomacea canaliculata]
MANLQTRCEVPKGNFIARGLRLMNDNSKELFPATPASSKDKKYMSMYTQDYHSLPVNVILEDLRRKGRQLKRETIRDVLFGQSPTAMYARWNIPKHIMQNPGGEKSAHLSDRTLDVKETKQDTSHLARQSTCIPVVNTKPEVWLNDFPHVIRGCPSGSQGRTCSIQSAVSLPHSSLPDLQSLQQKLKPEVLSGAEEWWKLAPEVDLRLLQNVLRLQERQPVQNYRLMSTFVPNARQIVEQWLEGATNQECQAALRFFTSLAGSGLIEVSNGGEQTARLKQVITALDSSSAARRAKATSSSKYDNDEDGRRQTSKRLSFLHLLDENTRRQRWMYTTWHHLPNYGISHLASNPASVYVSPRILQHRHYAIHPDWC